MRYILTLTLILLYTHSGYCQEINLKGISLSAAIELGLKNNPSILAAEQSINASKARYWSGMSLPKPEISYENQWIPSVSKSGVFSEKSFSISQSFEFPSVYFTMSDKLNKEEKLANFQFNRTQNNLICHIKTEYYNVLAKKNQVKSAEENLVITEDFYKKAEIRQNVGEGTSLESLTAKVQLSEARKNLDIAQNDLARAYSELSNTLGFIGNQSAQQLILTDSMVFNEYKIDEKELYSISESDNPLIKIATINTEIATLEKSLASSSYLPQLNFSYYMQNRDNDSKFHGYSVGVSVPLWFMFEQKGKIQEAEANQSISQLDLISAKNDMALEFKIAYTRFQNSLKQVKLYIDDILPQSEEIFRTANSSYDAGELTYLEYLQAKQTLVGSKNNYNNALFDYYESLFKIEEIIGQNLTNK